MIVWWCELTVTVYYLRWSSLSNLWLACGLLYWLNVLREAGIEVRSNPLRSCYRYMGSVDIPKAIFCKCRTGCPITKQGHGVIYFYSRELCQYGGNSGFVWRKKLRNHCLVGGTGNRTIRQCAEWVVVALLWRKIKLRYLMDKYHGSIGQRTQAS